MSTKPAEGYSYMDRSGTHVINKGSMHRITNISRNVRIIPVATYFAHKSSPKVPTQSDLEHQSPLRHEEVKLQQHK